MAFAAQLQALRPGWEEYWPDRDLEGMGDRALTRMERAVRAWSLEAVRPLGGGNVALVGEASRAGRRVVVKVLPDCTGEDLAAEGRALAAWSGSGAAVELLDARDDGLTLLLERLEPGEPMDEAGLGWHEALAELGALARRLRAATPGGPIHGDLHPGNALRGPAG